MELELECSSVRVFQYWDNYHNRKVKNWWNYRWIYTYQSYIDFYTLDEEGEWLIVDDWDAYREEERKRDEKLCELYGDYEHWFKEKETGDRALDFISPTISYYYIEYYQPECELPVCGYAIVDSGIFS